MDEAYKAINWSVIFLIALLIPIGIAMDNTGAAKYLGGFILDFSSRYYSDPYLQATAVVSILYFITFF